jgi:pimeloyl-ACP methyl ester carboxylesterase
MMSFKKSTIVRFRNGLGRVFFQYGEHVVPALTGRAARKLWFTAPPRMSELPVPAGAEPFEVLAQGHVVRGSVWSPSGGSETVAAQPPRPPSATPVVYLVHGWGGRGSQFGSLVEPLLESGHRVVMFDAPAHGASDHGPVGPRSTNGVEFAKALDAVFCRFGPAEAVIAHSMGTISTYLAIRYGWLGTERLVFVAPMVQFTGLLDQFQEVLGFGPRSRRVLEREVKDFVGIPVREFDARFQAAYVDPLPTLVLTDRGDRQTPYADVVHFAETIDAPLITTEGLGHRKILRDPETVRTIVEFVTGGRVATGLESA